MKTGQKRLVEIRREKKEAVRERRRAENAELVANTPVIQAPVAKFATLVIDPPWDMGEVNVFGRAKPTYALMSVDELKALPVAEYADEDAHLYLWFTNLALPVAPVLLEHWGFRYATCLTWNKKPSFGMGYYFRGQTEHILFGVRGSQALRRHDVGTSLHWDRPGPHSTKPPEFFELVESCSPGPYLEMFARKPRPGWTVWGAEAAGTENSTTEGHAVEPDIGGEIGEQR